MTMVRARATYYWEYLVLVVDLVLESKGAFTLGSWVLVPEYDTRWALSVNAPFFEYPRQNPGMVPVLEYRVSTLNSGNQVKSSQVKSIFI